MKQTIVKTCKRCGQEKPHHDRTYRCIDCKKVYMQYKKQYGRMKYWPNPVKDNYFNP
jgi:hypothetical protein